MNKRLKGFIEDEWEYLVSPGKRSACEIKGILNNIYGALNVSDITEDEFTEIYNKFRAEAIRKRFVDESDCKCPICYKLTKDLDKLEEVNGYV